MYRNILTRWMIPVICLIFLFSLVPSARAEVTAADYDGALAAIEQGYKDHVAQIDLSAYNVSSEYISEYFTEQLRAGAYPWYASSFHYSHYTETGIITTFTYTNLDPAEYDYALYEQRVAEILAATVFEDMTDWQIALSIHDYLAANCAYDESLTYYEGYDAIVRGTAVCKGYAEAYMDLLNRVGIPCRYVSSKAMDHGWNLVQIGGEWYHVDVTWDDPTDDHEGRVNHKYFLISDDAISDEDHEHYGWESDIQCTDTSMDTDRFWHGITSQICYANGDLCYFREKTDKTVYTVYSRTDDGTQEEIASFDAGYIKIAGSHKNGTHYNHDGLTLWNGKLYFSDMKKVYCVSTEGGKKSTVYSHDYEALDTFIAGSHVVDGVLHLTLSDSSRENLTTMQIDLGVDAHTHAYTGEVTAPTCQSIGCTRYSCECGITYEANWLPATDHTYDEGTVIREATTQQAGTKRYSCTACGESYDEEIPILSNTDNGYTGSKSETEADPPHIALIAVGVIVLLILIFRKKKK